MSESAASRCPRRAKSAPFTPKPLDPPGRWSFASFVALVQPICRKALASEHIQPLGHASLRMFECCPCNLDKSSNAFRGKQTVLGLPAVVILAVSTQNCVTLNLWRCFLGTGRHQEVLGEGWITLDRYLWASAILDSRMIWWDGRKHLVPLLDLVSPRKLCLWCQWGNKEALRSMRSLQTMKGYLCSHTCNKYGLTGVLV